MRGREATDVARLDDEPAVTPRRQEATDVVEVPRRALLEVEQNRLAQAGRVPGLFEVRPAEEQRVEERNRRVVRGMKLSAYGCHVDLDRVDAVCGRLERRTEVVACVVGHAEDVAVVVAQVDLQLRAELKRGEPRGEALCVRIEDDEHAEQQHAEH